MRVDHHSGRRRRVVGIAIVGVSGGVIAFGSDVAFEPGDDGHECAAGILGAGGDYARSCPAGGAYDARRAAAGAYDSGGAAKAVYLWCA